MRLVLLLLLLAAPAAAHFEPGTRIRTLILAAEDEALALYMRAPAPLLFSDLIVAAQAADAPLASPFLYGEPVAGGVRFRLDLAAIHAGEAAFRARLARAFRFAQGGTPLAAEVVDWRIRLRDPGAGFASVEEARAALAEEMPRLDPVFGEAMIEVRYRIPADPKGTLRLDPGLPELDLPAGVTLDTHMIDARETAGKPGEGVVPPDAAAQ